MAKGDRRVTGLATVLILTVAVGASAGEYEDGVAAHRSGDYATVLRLWMPLAERGNLNAQYNLGVMHYLGRNSCSRGISWTNQGSPRSSR